MAAAMAAAATARSMRGSMGAATNADTSEQTMAAAARDAAQRANVANSLHGMTNRGPAELGGLETTGVFSEAGQGNGALAGAGPRGEVGGVFASAVNGMAGAEAAQTFDAKWGANSFAGHEPSGVEQAMGRAMASRGWGNPVGDSMPGMNLSTAQSQSPPWASNGTAADMINMSPLQREATVRWINGEYGKTKRAELTVGKAVSDARARAYGFDPGVASATSWSYNGKGGVD